MGNIEQIVQKNSDEVSLVRQQLMNQQKQIDDLARKQSLHEGDGSTAASSNGSPTRFQKRKPYQEEVVDKTLVIHRWGLEREFASAGDG